MTKCMMILVLGAMAAFVGCNKPVPTSTEPESVSSDKTNDSTRQEDWARELTNALASKDYATVVSRFDATMTQAMSTSKLGQTWEGVAGKTGSFQSIKGTRKDQVQGTEVVFVDTVFASGELTLQFSFNDSGQVTGFFIRPEGFSFK